MLLTNSFNGGTNGVAISAGNSGGASGDPLSSVSSWTYSNENATGQRAPLVAKTGTSFDQAVWRDFVTSAKTLYVRDVIRLPNNPTYDAPIVRIALFGGVVGSAAVNTNRTMSIRDSADAVVATTTTVVPLNQWVRVEFMVTAGSTTSNGTAELRLYLDADSMTLTESKTATGNFNTSKPDNVTFGSMGTAYYVDDIAISDEGWIGPAGPSEQVVPVGQVTQTNRAQPILGRKTRMVGQTGQADHAQPVTVLKSRATGQPGETNVALPILGRKIRAIGQAAQADLALPIVGRKIRAIGQAAESDAAQQIIGLAGSAVAQAAETDLAQPVIGRKVYTIGQAVDTSTALAVQPAKTRMLGRAAEAAAALAIRPVKTRMLGQAVETDLSLRLYIAALDLPVETDMALPITVVQSRSRPSRAGHPYVDWRASTPYI